MTCNRPARCGTLGGEQRHYRLGEPLCDACKLARSDLDRARYLVKKSGWRLPMAEAYARLGLPRDRTDMAQEAT